MMRSQERCVAFCIQPCASVSALVEPAGAACASNRARWRSPATGAQAQRPNSRGDGGELKAAERSLPPRTSRCAIRQAMCPVALATWHDGFERAGSPAAGCDTSPTLRFKKPRAYRRVASTHCFSMKTCADDAAQRGRARACCFESTLGLPRGQNWERSLLRSSGTARHSALPSSPAKVRGSPREPRHPQLSSTTKSNTMRSVAPPNLLDLVSPHAAAR